ncbi:uncharacterized protein LOC62_07G008847 [Vanrija pseudolonga]|uniref:Uncharacterized protein n=1 Tax=Vanrija pseudolonga TaxID=143232 RepID=A0AAF1BLR1_9TREE|nr:hypothetical protein LOC62_07G008847 [Vanrija pseudolonga]
MSLAATPTPASMMDVMAMRGSPLHSPLHSPMHSPFFTPSRRSSPLTTPTLKAPGMPILWAGETKAIAHTCDQSSSDIARPATPCDTCDKRQQAKGPAAAESSGDKIVDEVAEMFPSLTAGDKCLMEVVGVVPTHAVRCWAEDTCVMPEARADMVIVFVPLGFRWHREGLHEGITKRANAVASARAKKHGHKVSSPLTSKRIDIRPYNEFYHLAPVRTLIVNICYDPEHPALADSSISLFLSPEYEWPSVKDITVMFTPRHELSKTCHTDLEYRSRMAAMSGQLLGIMHDPIMGLMDYLPEHPLRLVGLVEMDPRLLGSVPTPQEKSTRSGASSPPDPIHRLQVAGTTAAMVAQQWIPTAPRETADKPLSTDVRNNELAQHIRDAMVIAAGWRSDEARPHWYDTPESINKARRSISVMSRDQWKKHVGDETFLLATVV